MRLIVDGARAGARNMALDEALMRSAAGTRGVTLRFYGWNPPCLSFGRNQTSIGRYDREAAAGRGIDIVRRPTGGRAVYHDRELTYSVTAPVETWGSLRNAYCRINRALAAGLATLGVPVACAPERTEPGRAPPPDARACFRDPLPGEVTAGGRKLVGSAQWRDGGALLQHGSLLLHDDQVVVQQLQAQQTASKPMDTGAIALADLLSAPPDAGVLIEALSDGFAGEFGERPAPGGLTDAERRAADALVPRFTDPGWTWRR